MKPMLAFQKMPDLTAAPYPLIASPKLDGIRCLIVDGVAVSRSLKPIRNKFVQSILGRPELNGLDGELIVGEETDPDVYLRTNSGVMSIEGEPDFGFKVFDDWTRTGPYDGWNWDRLATYLDEGLVRHVGQYVEDHEYHVCESADEVLNVEGNYLEMGYEGLILRNQTAPYKFGRSTLKEFALVKVKRFEDAEAEILEVQEAMFNDNEATTNELGRTHRSASQEGRTRGKGMVGRFVCKSPPGYSEPTFEIGSFKGLVNEEKARIWDNHSDYVGMIVKFKHFPHGAKDRPRHPVFLGFRDKDDQS